MTVVDINNKVKQIYFQMLLCLYFIFPDDVLIATKETEKTIDLDCSKPEYPCFQEKTTTEISNVSKKKIDFPSAASNSSNNHSFSQLDSKRLKCLRPIKNSAGLLLLLSIFM